MQLRRISSVGVHIALPPAVVIASGLQAVMFIFLCLPYAISVPCPALCKLNEMLVVMIVSVLFQVSVVLGSPCIRE